MARRWRAEHGRLHDRRQGRSLAAGFPLALASGMISAMTATAGFGRTLNLAAIVVTAMTGEDARGIGLRAAGRHGPGQRSQRPLSATIACDGAAAGRWAPCKRSGARHHGEAGHPRRPLRRGPRATAGRGGRSSAARIVAGRADNGPAMPAGLSMPSAVEVGPSDPPPKCR